MHDIDPSNGEKYRSLLSAHSLFVSFIPTGQIKQKDEVSSEKDPLGHLVQEGEPLNGE